MPDSLRKESTLEKIRPTLRGTYGKTSMVDALAEVLAEKIDAEGWSAARLEYEIMFICWSWFAGGNTAASVAAEINRALSDA